MTPAWASGKLQPPSGVQGRAGELHPLASPRVHVTPPRGPDLPGRVPVATEKGQETALRPTRALLELGRIS